MAIISELELTSELSRRNFLKLPLVVASGGGSRDDIQDKEIAVLGSQIEELTKNLDRLDRLLTDHVRFTTRDELDQNLELKRLRSKLDPPHPQRFFRG